MENFDIEEESRKTQKIIDRLERSAEESVKDILKYFDRIHDNLSNYNNLLIGAFFALAQFNSNVSRWTIIIPVINLWFLIWINYRLMQKSRFEADILNQPQHLIDRYVRSGTITNLFSLLSILSTMFVTLSFLYYLLIY